MNTPVRNIQKRWNAVMHDRWEDFFKRWKSVRRHPTSRAVHALRSASRRLASSISVAALSAGVPGEQASHRLERISNHMGPLRDNHVYRKTLDRLATSSNAKPFFRFLVLQKSKEHKRLAKVFRRHPKPAVHRHIENIDRKFQRLTKNWTAEEYRAAFEKVLHRRFEALRHAHQAWTDEPDNKRFHRMRVELRDLRYDTENIAEVLGLIRTRAIQATVRTLRSLQTSMGDIHDIHKLRTQLVAWISRRPAQKRALEMKVASELQRKFESRMVDFKDHCLVFEDLLPLLQGPDRRRIRGSAAKKSSN